MEIEKKDIFYIRNSLNPNIDSDMIKQNNIRIIKNIFQKMKEYIAPYTGHLSEIISSPIAYDNNKFMQINILKNIVRCNIFNSDISAKDEYIYIIGTKNTSSKFIESYIDEKDEYLQFLCKNFTLFIDDIFLKIKDIEIEYGAIKKIEKTDKHSLVNHKLLETNIVDSVNSMKLSVKKHDKIKKKNIELIRNILKEFSILFNGEEIVVRKFFGKKQEREITYLNLLFNPNREKDTCVLLRSKETMNFTDYKLAYYIIGNNNDLINNKWADSSKFIEDIDDFILNFFIENFDYYTKILLSELKDLNPRFDSDMFIELISKAYR